MKNLLRLPTLFLLSIIVVLSGCGGGGGSGGGGGPSGTPLSSAKAITAYSLAGVAATINETNKTIAVTLPFGTSVTALVASFTATGTSVAIGGATQASGGTANDFTNPVIYTVFAADNTSVSYTVTVTVALPSVKAITAYSLAGLAGTVNETNKTIAVTLPSGTNVTALVATFTTTGASVNVGTALQTSGATANNFTNPVVYTVTAADGSTVNYTVTVTIAPPSTIGGTVNGLAAGASIVLQLNGNTQTVSANGAFTFATTISSGSYNVTILTPPAGQPCTLTYGSGTVVLGSNVTNVNVICGPAFVGTWTNTGSSAGTEFQTATLLPNGKVLTAGGVSGYGIYYGIIAATQLYDPTTGLWSPLGYMTTARHMHTATLLSNGKVLVAGGLDGLWHSLRSAEIYDPATQTWTATGSMSTLRYGHSAMLLPNGKVLVMGGDSCASTELYDPATGTWSPGASMITPAACVQFGNFTATLLPNGKVLVAGGVSGSTPVATAQLYDPATGIWSLTGSMTIPRAFHTATLLPNGKVLVAGMSGSYATATTGASAELYDPATGTWAATGSMTAVRSGIAILLPTGKVLVVGGGGSANASTNDLYDPVTGTWVATGTLLTPVFSGYSAVLLQTGKVLLAGGLSTVIGANGYAQYANPSELYW